MTQLISRGRDSSNHTADFSIHKHIMENIPSQSHGPGRDLPKKGEFTHPDLRTFISLSTDMRHMYIYIVTYIT